MTDAFSDASAIVNQVNQNGGESAARLMMDSVNNAREDFKEPSLNKVGNGYNNYMTVLSEELQKSGVLPELSVGWAKANIDVIGNGRSISDNDIRKFEHQADNSTNPVDQMMIKSLREQAPDLKHASKDQNGQETVITDKDLNASLENNDSDRHYSMPDGLGHDPNARRAKVLFEKDPESGRDLFDFLDGINHEGKRTGKVDRNDLVTFNEMARKGEFGDKFTPEQIQTVKELEERWDYEGQKIHDGGLFVQDLTRESIANGIGEANGIKEIKPSTMMDIAMDRGLTDKVATDDDSPEGMTQRLLENDNKLFNLLDGMRNNGERDGNVYRSDLVAFNETIKRDPQFAKQFTAEEIKTVKELEAHWDEGKELHVNMDYMTRDSIAKGLGFKEVSVQEQVEPRLNPPAQVPDEEVWAPEETLALDSSNQIREPRVRPEQGVDARIARMEKELMQKSIADEHKAPSEAESEFRVSRDVADEFMRASKQRVGEGPYQVATRLLLGEGASPVGHHRKIMELARALKTDYQDRTGDRSDKMVQMKVGEDLLTDSNAMKILGQSPALQERFNQRFQQRRQGRGR